MDYKTAIIEMLSRIDNERFLKQVYTIVAMHIRKTEV